MKGGKQDCYTPNLQVLRIDREGMINNIFFDDVIWQLWRKNTCWLQMTSMQHK